MKVYLLSEQSYEDLSGFRVELRGVYASKDRANQEKEKLQKAAVELGHDLLYSVAHIVEEEEVIE